jgi:hypothetical protein
MRAAERGAGAISQRGGREQAVRMDERALAVDPLRLAGSAPEPGAVDGQGATFRIGSAGPGPSPDPAAGRAVNSDRATKCTTPNACLPADSGDRALAAGLRA